MASVRRSLLTASHDALNARYRQWQAQTVVGQYGADHASESECVSQLALCDLSTLDRCGFKGADTPDWLSKQGVTFPQIPNHTHWDSASGLTARLSNEEFLLLRNPFEEGKRPSVFDADPDGSVRAYPLPRQDSHAWLYACGHRAAAMMSFVCAVDLRPDQFAAGTVAQTSVAKINGIVIRQDLGAIPGFHLLCDQPSIAYWWGALLDAAGPLGGRPVGLNAVLAHHRP